MNVSAVTTAIGLMSGTSMDGVDAAVIETDGDAVFATGSFVTTPYPSAFQDRLRSLAGEIPDEAGDPETAAIVRDLTLLHARAVDGVLASAQLTPDQVDVIGFHGHTVFHAPARGITCQIGDGGLLARETGIAVVDNFRSADVAAGGEGAPLAPVFHVALAREVERPVCVLNLGGVGNVTWISPDGGAIAFDTGPGNAMIDDWVRTHSNQLWDEDGHIARRGRAAADVVGRLCEHEYFGQPAPKSLDRDAFSADLLADMSLEDGAATLSAFTAQAVALAARQFPAPPLRWLVCGGGRLNPAIMANLRARLDAPVEPVESVGWNGDALEAQAFGFLAVRSLNGQPLSYPQTTGVSRPLTGGRLHQP